MKRIKLKERIFGYIVEQLDKKEQIRPKTIEIIVDSVVLFISQNYRRRKYNNKKGQ